MAMKPSDAKSNRIVCALSDQPIFQGNKAACPDCGHMIRVVMRKNGWTFRPHTDDGKEIK